MISAARVNTLASSVPLITTRPLADASWRRFLASFFSTCRSLLLCRFFGGCDTTFFVVDGSMGSSSSLSSSSVFFELCTGPPLIGWAINSTPNCRARLTTAFFTSLFLVADDRAAKRVKESLKGVHRLDSVLDSNGHWHTIRSRAKRSFKYLSLNPLLLLLSVAVSKTYKKKEENRKSLKIE